MVEHLNLFLIAFLLQLFSTSAFTATSFPIFHQGGKNDSPFNPTHEKERNAWRLL